MGRNIYEPIRKKAEEWLWYDENQPKSHYFSNAEEHDRFRSLHDRDCVLTGGNLKADTLFSLWMPLRHTIMRLNDRAAVREVGDISRKYVFLREFVKGNNVEKLLPESEPVVWKLSELFERGMGRENVFLLPERQLNCARARKPYYDYVPAMLREAFPGGAFSKYWNSPEAYLQWIDYEHLDMFFDGCISPEHVRDLSGSGDVRISLAPEGMAPMERMLDNYIELLKERKKYFNQEVSHVPEKQPR